MKIAFNPSTVAALITPPNNKDITFDLRGRNIFARGVKFCGTDTWRDIKINNVSIGSNILDLRNGSNTTLTNTNGVVTINSTWRPVVDNLTSDSTTSSLSANQGKVLKALIDGKSDSGHTHDDRYLRLAGGWMSGDINFGGDNKIYWGRNTDSASISFKNDGDGDADSYMSFVTSDNGNEYFRWSHSSGSTNTEWMALRSDGLRIGGTKVSLEGHSHNDLYYTKTEVNNKLNGKLNYRLFWERTNIDLNSITEAWHTYEVNNGTGTANTPTNASWHQAVLWGTGDTDYAVLLCTAYTSNYSLYLRHKLAGKWYNWIQLAATTDIPSSLKNPYALTISLNGTSQGPYDGSAAKNINITPSSIGAATSDHNHDGRYVRYYAVTTLDCNNLAVGLTSAGVSATNAAHTNHSAFLYISDVGTPFQIQIPDSSVPYIYKRYYSSGTWSGWFKLNAGYADSAGSATKLQTPRTIWGQSFDGTGNVSGFMKNVTGLIYGNDIGDDWSDGNNTHPWYGIDYRHCVDSVETGKAYTSISSYFGLYFKTGGSRFIFDGGNVGIGTTSPIEKLDVNGNIISNNIRIYGNEVTNDSKGLFIQASDKTNRAFLTYNGNVENTSYLNICSAFGNIVLSPSRNVGIGTTTPAYKLDVIGSLRIYSTYPLLRIENSSGGTAETSIYISNGTAGWTIGVNPWGVGSGVFGIGQYSGSGSSNWRFKIDNSGYCYTQSYLNLGAGNEKNASSPPYVWGVNGSDNYLRTYATSALRVAYASNATNSINSNRLNSNSEFALGNNFLLYFNTAGLESSGVNNAAPDKDWWHIIRMNHPNSKGYFSELAIALNSYNGVYWRTINYGREAKSWTRLANIEDLAWDNITGKPSSYTPSAHTHSWTSITYKIVAGNEFNIVNAGFTGDMWFNYAPINDRSKTATINSYWFGNGHQGLASVTASGFVKNGSSNSYVLLGDGGHQTISSLSVNYATSAGNADTVDGYHATMGSNKPWGTIPVIHTSGWMDIGLQLEFHHDNTTGSDYSTILRCTGNYSNIVNLPSATGTLALTSDIPTTLPANGGNADTVDGEHASSFVRAGNYESADLNKLDTYSFIKSVNSNNKDTSPKGNTGWYNVILAVYRNGNGDGPGYIGQIALGMTTNTDDMFFRGSRTDSWKTVIHSGNISSQTVANAYHLRINSANTWSTWYWSGLSGQPSWLWGSNDGTNMYVWNPSNFRVASATKLQTARKIWGLNFDGTANVDGTLTITDSGSDDPHIISTVSKWFHIVSKYKLVLYAGDYNSSQRDAINILSNHNVGIGVDPSYKLHVAGDIYTTTGFKKNGSSDSYVLLGGGGHKLESALNVAHATTSGRSWDVSILGQHWSRLYVGVPHIMHHSSIFSISGSIGCVVFCLTFLVESNHPGNATIICLFSGSYTQPKMRALAKSDGTVLVDLFWSGNDCSLSSSTQQMTINVIANALLGSISPITTLTNDDTIPNGYSNTCEFLCTSKTSNFYNIRATGNSYATHFYESSDKALKKNIKSILSSTNIPKIREFDWKDTGEHSYGFIALELEELGYGCLVSEANGKKTVNYTATLALTVAKLLNLINIQNKKISNLTKELKALKYGRKKNS